jgi:uncharacterized protein HemY
VAAAICQACTSYTLLSEFRKRCLQEVQDTQHGELAAFATSVQTMHANDAACTLEAHTLARPLTELHLHVRRGQLLCRLGYWTAGTHHLQACVKHAEAIEDVPLHAECLLALARCEAHLQHFEQAIELLQQAQAFGGTIDFWARSLCDYAQYRHA